MSFRLSIRVSATLNKDTHERRLLISSHSKLDMCCFIFQLHQISHMNVVFPPFQLFREHHDKHKQPHIDTREIICCVPWHFSVNDTCCKLSQPSWMVQTTENRMKIKYLSIERKLYAKPIQISVSVFGGTFRGHFHLFCFFFFLLDSL